MPTTLLAAVLLGATAAVLVGRWLGAGGRARVEARAGLDALCTMKWRDYTHLVQDLLGARGLALSAEVRVPGEGGFDLLMERGGSRYLVDCKNGATQRITAEVVREFGALVTARGADGGILAATGEADRDALTAATMARVEVLSGESLWRQILPWVPHDIREEARSSATQATRRTLMIAIGSGIACALLSLLLLGTGPGTAAPENLPAPVPATAAPTPASPAPAALPGAPIRAPEAAPSAEQIEVHRGTAVLNVRGLPMVQDAYWTTRSTLVVELQSSTVQLSDAMVDSVCRMLLEFEELRYTRLQIETPAAEAGRTPQVRWRQCR